MSNQRQLGIGFYVWLNDHNETFPRYNHSSSGPHKLQFWKWNYRMFEAGCFDSMAILKDPSIDSKYDFAAVDHNFPTHASGSEYYTAYGIATYCSYGYNTTLGRSAISNAITAKMAQIINPSGMFMTMDTFRLRSGEREGYCWAKGDLTWSPTTAGEPDSRRHGGHVNALYVDGHVDSLKVGDDMDPFHTGIPSRYATPNPWSRDGKVH